MEVRLVGGFLPLLLLAWLPSGLTHCISGVINVSVSLDLSCQHLLQTGSNGISGEMKCFTTTQNNGKKQNEGGVVILNSSIQLVITGVNKTYTGMYASRSENTMNMYDYGHSNDIKDVTAGQPEESDITGECRLVVSLENLTVKTCKPAGQGMKNQINITALNDLSSPCTCAASTGICMCRAFSTGPNLTAAGNGTQGTVHGCGPGAPQFNVTNKDTWTGPNFALCIFIGLAVGTLLYMPIICLLLWQRRRNSRGMPVAEGNQLSMAAPVTGTEDLAYANLKFEKKTTKPTSSDVTYTDIKPLAQKQSGEDAGASKAGVGVSPNGEDK